MDMEEILKAYLYFEDKSNSSTIAAELTKAWVVLAAALVLPPPLTVFQLGDAIFHGLGQVLEKYPELANGGRPL